MPSHPLAKPAQCLRRILGWAAQTVQGPVRWDLLAGLDGLAELRRTNGRANRVQNDRIARSRYGVREHAAEHRCSAPIGRIAPGGARSREPDAACPRGHDGVVTDHTVVGAVADGDRPEAVCLRFHHGRLHRVSTSDLAETEVTVHDHDGVRLALDRHIRVGVGHTPAHGSGIAAQVPHTVRIHSPEVGLDHCVGDDRGVDLADPDRHEGGHAKTTQGLLIDQALLVCCRHVLFPRSVMGFAIAGRGQSSDSRRSGLAISSLLSWLKESTVKKIVKAGAIIMCG